MGTLQPRCGCGNSDEGEQPAITHTGPSSVHPHLVSDTRKDVCTIFCNGLAWLFMLVDTSDLVSVTDFRTSLSRFINEAAENGRRFVILNSNTPTAALVSIADLERLKALDAAPGVGASSPGVAVVEIEPPVLADLEQHPGHAVVGRQADGEPVLWPLAGHMFVVGRASAGAALCFSAAIAGAVPDPDVPTEFVVGAAGSHVSLRHERLHQGFPIVVELDLREPVRRQLFAEKLQGEIDRRRGLLAAARVETVDELRRVESGPTQVPNLVVVLPDGDGLEPGVDDPASSDVAPVLFDVLMQGTELGIHLWFGSSEPASSFVPSWLQQMRRTVAQRVSSRVVLGAIETDWQSRELLGSYVAARTSVPSGAGWFVADRGTGVQEFVVADVSAELGSVVEPSGECLSWRPWLAQPLWLGDIPHVRRDAGAGLVFPIGVTNPPWEALAISLEETPHVCIVGGAFSGVESVLATLIGSALGTYAPAECAFLVIDGDAALAEVAGLANVAGYTTTGDADAVERVVGEALRILELRRDRMTTAKQSFDEYTALKGDEPTAADPYGRLVLAVALLERLSALVQSQVEQLLTVGREFGIHVVATATRDTAGARLARHFAFPLRLAGTDAGEVRGTILRNLVRGIPVDQPGRCVDLRSGRPGRIADPHPGVHSTGKG